MNYPLSLQTELKHDTTAEVRFDSGSRALYSTDASNYRQVPVGVIIPRDIKDVIRTIEICRKYGVPVLPRGGGTSLAGQCCNVAVVIDTSKYLNRILEIHPEKQFGRVQPGVILDDLRSAAEEYHLTFGPDPATHNRCTIGGMIGNNSCGVHSIMAGKTDENIEELDILTYDGLHTCVGKTAENELEQIIGEGGRRGEIYSKLKALADKYAKLIRERYPRIPRRVSGYNLDQLLPENGFHVARALVGSEGTCVTVLEATTRLVSSPPQRVLVVLGFRDAFVAADYVPQILASGPIGLEGIDDRLMEFLIRKNLHREKVALFPQGGGWLLVEFGGKNKDEATAQARLLMESFRNIKDAPAMRLFEDDREKHMVWRVRESSLGATAFVPGERDTWEGWEDSAVHPEKLGAYLRDLRTLMDRYGYRGALYGHFGDGCVHTRIDFDLTSNEGIRRFRSFVEEAADLVVRYGGSLSGEHGDGQSRAELLHKMFGKELVEAFREFKRIWDPEGKMNPGKIVDAYRMDENLRLGPNFQSPRIRTHFQFPAEEGSFSRATLRCVGVGECRKLNGGTMCPSFMATREEQHSTRGRAHLLFEMLQGSPLGNGFRERSVKEALDLCLACKACKSECPVNVDMATYKAEFLSHYYKYRIRPVAAYTMGLIFLWSRIASHFPALANRFAQTGLAKALAGIAPQRTIPPFATPTFRTWFRRRASRLEGMPSVVLWPDTFHNYFHPEVAIAAVEVLETFGFRVIVPTKSLCCGRPLYDYGMLSLAKRKLKQILNALSLEIAAEIPVVFLEPSCGAVFRDELSNLFPQEVKARRLSKLVFSFSEFLENRELPKLSEKALVHGHCHQQSIFGMRSEEQLLSKLGLDFEILDSGCCGMAGSFGFEKKHYDVSLQIGERRLLPAVRNADTRTLLITNGFSCRQQIEQCTGRRVLHIAQVIQMALK